MACRELTGQTNLTLGIDKQYSTVVAVSPDKYHSPASRGNLEIEESLAGGRRPKGLPARSFIPVAQTLTIGTAQYVWVPQQG